MAQLLLFPDPRPLVERLGPEFFRTAPESPGVYLMRDARDAVLYVGKAKNLRKRLASYRVANPDRVPRRHLRLLRAVERIELRPCGTESAALENEAALLRTLRPSYNRAGTWPGTPCFLAWRSNELTLDLGILPTADSAWRCQGPFSVAANFTRAALARVLWCALRPESGVAGLPQGWFSAFSARVSSIPRPEALSCQWARCASAVEGLFAGLPAALREWTLERTTGWTHCFDLAVRDADLETLAEFSERRLSLGRGEQAETEPALAVPAAGAGS